MFRRLLITMCIAFSQGHGSTLRAMQYLRSDTHLYAWKSPSGVAHEILHDGLADIALSHAPMAPSHAVLTL